MTAAFPPSHARPYLHGLDEVVAQQLDQALSHLGMIVHMQVSVFCEE